jgi:hypothetical protein
MWQLYKSQMQIPRGASHKNSLRQRRSGFRRFAIYLPNDDVELGRACCKRLKAPGFVPQPPVQLDGSRPAAR